MMQADDADAAQTKRFKTPEDALALALAYVDSRRGRSPPDRLSEAALIIEVLNACDLVIEQKPTAAAIATPETTPRPEKSQLTREQIKDACCRWKITPPKLRREAGLTRGTVRSLLFASYRRPPRKETLRLVEHALIRLGADLESL